MKIETFLYGKTYGSLLVTKFRVVFVYKPSSYILDGESCKAEIE